MYLSPRKKLFFAMPALVLVLAVFLLFRFQRDEHLFVSFCQELFATEMQGDTLAMHYHIRHPEDFQIYSYEPTLPVYQAGSELSVPVRLENTLAQMEKIDPEHLSGQNAILYQLLKQSLTLQLSLSRYSYYSDPLSPSGGMQTELPLLLTEYRFDTLRDVEDYLALLEQLDSYLSGLLLYEQEKAAAGKFMAESSAQKLIEQCHTMIDVDQLRQGTHFLQVTFKERTEKLYQEQVLSNEQKSHYDEENDRLLKTVVQPAYETLADGLEVLGNQCQKLAGLSAYPQGCDYYALYFRSQTGSPISPAQWKEVLADEIGRSYQELSALFTAHPEIRDMLNSDSIFFPLTDAETILEQLAFRMQEDFPLLPVPVTYRVKTVSDCLSPYVAPAYYLTPAIDATTDNVIYLNPRSHPDSLELYTVLAHEGFPGHLYQSVYSTEYLASQNVLPLRHLLGCSGYAEGWALYVEFLSYDYGAQLLRDQGKELDSYCCEALKLNRRLQLALLSLLDISVHNDGADEKQVSTILKNFGLSNGSRVYAYLVEEPANYCKYFIGYLEILSLQQEAEALWGKDYSAMRFHQFLLECGSSDFEWIHQNLKAAALN